MQLVQKFSQVGVKISKTKSRLDVIKSIKTWTTLPSSLKHDFYSKGH
ncbi:Lmo0850 family protein [Aeribacillus pallidus]